MGELGNLCLHLEDLDGYLVETVCVDIAEFQMETNQGKSSSLKVYADGRTMNSCRKIQGGSEEAELKVTKLRKENEDEIVNSVK